MEWELRLKKIKEYSKSSNSTKPKRKILADKNNSN